MLTRIRCTHTAVGLVVATTTALADQNAAGRIQEKSQLTIKNTQKIKNKLKIYSSKKKRKLYNI